MVTMVVTREKDKLCQRYHFFSNYTSWVSIL